MPATQPSTGPPVRVSRVVRSFGKLKVLDEVSFEVQPGERFCLIGSNGAGKTTLLAILAGIRRPDSGEATLFGCDPADPSLKVRRGIQLERPYFPYYAKVAEIVWLFSGMHPLAVYDKALPQRFGLRGEAYIRHLSKGQRQRLAILLATLGRPELLIVDEPTSGLDPEAKADLWKSIDRHLREAPDRALLFTTHELGEAEQWAHRVAVLHRGRIAAIGRPSDLCRTLIGTEMKLTIVANGSRSLEKIVGTIPLELFAGLRIAGDEATVYTDQPKKVLELLPIEETAQLQVRHVSLEDVFFRVTQGETYARSPDQSR